MKWKTIKEIILYTMENALDQYKIPENKVSVTEAIDCLRKSFFIRMGYTPDNLEISNTTLFIGKAVHETFANTLSMDSFLPYDFDFEILVEDDLLSGHIDVLIYHDEERYILELKTIQNVPQKPLKNHTLQVRTYFELAKSLFNPTKAFIAYIPKKPDLVRVYEVTPDSNAYAYVKSRARILKDALEQGIPPKIKSTEYCYFCPYNLVCKK